MSVRSFQCLEVVHCILENLILLSIYIQLVSMCCLVVLKQELAGTEETVDFFYFSVSFFLMGFLSFVSSFL
jgi:hypothetical protein